MTEVICVLNRKSASFSYRYCDSAGGFVGWTLVFIRTSGVLRVKSVAFLEMRSSSANGRVFENLVAPGAAFFKAWAQISPNGLKAIEACQ